MAAIRVQMEEWHTFMPGIRMYKGKKTYFYNGEILRDEETGEFLIYDWKERYSWEVIIVLPGVVVIPYGTFTYCTNVETVIESDSVKRIEKLAFSNLSNCQETLSLLDERHSNFASRCLPSSFHLLVEKLVPRS